MDIIEFYDIFFEEVDEFLVEMEFYFLELDVDNLDVEWFNVIFWVVYLIKGGVGMFGFEVL